MKKYKLSRYNYYFDIDDYLVIFNTLYGKIIKLKNISKSNLIYKTKKLNEEKFEDTILNECIDKGILIDEEINEKMLLKNIYRDYQQSKKLFLIILPTEKCNLRCIYCYEKFIKGSMSTQTQDNVLDFLNTKLSEYESLYISWFGGEPLLAIDIIEEMSKRIIEICKIKGVSYNAGITTNGTLLSENNFTKLLKCKVTNYQITLDGAKDTHDTQRVTISGEGTFSKIFSNLKMIKMFKDDFSILLRTNISVETEHSIKDYIDNIYDEFKDDTRFKLHFVAIADLTGDLKSTIDLCDTYHLFPYYHYAKKKGITFDFYKSLYKRSNMACYAANPNAYVIGSDGYIYKCTVAFENPKNIIGKLEHGKMDLDLSKKQMWENNGFETSKKCEKCRFLPLCFGKFCPLEKIEHSKEPCPPFEKYIKKYFEIFYS